MSPACAFCHDPAVCYAEPNNPATVYVLAHAGRPCCRECRNELTGVPLAPPLAPRQDDRRRRGRTPVDVNPLWDAAVRVQEER